jgi:transposase InsO family protein
MPSVSDLSLAVGTARACDALGLARASYYRGLQPQQPARERPTPERALSAAERQVVLDTLHCEPFVDKAPAQVWATLLDQGTYLCSPRTMYRILEDAQEVRERRDQLRHPAYKKSELLAQAPNQVWSWDITKLLGPAKWTYFYLYVILDIFSRYVVGWMVADGESATLASQLIDQTCTKQGIPRGQLTLHADRGTSMKSKAVALLLSDLGVTKTHSRPHVSDDNPSPRATSAHSSTVPTSPAASARSRTPAPSAGASSPGTTLSTATPASGCSPPRASTTAAPPTCSPSARASSPTPTWPTRNASSASHLRRPHCRPPPGSTPRRTSPPRRNLLFSKFDPSLSQSR